MAILESFSQLSGEDETSLRQPETRTTEMVEEQRAESADAAEVGAELRMGTAARVGDGDESGSDHEETRAAERGRGRRTPSSRFYAILEAERRRERASPTRHDDDDDDY